MHHNGLIIFSISYDKFSKQNVEFLWQNLENSIQYHIPLLLKNKNNTYSIQLNSKNCTKKNDIIYWLLQLSTATACDLGYPFSFPCHTNKSSNQSSQT